MRVKTVKDIGLAIRARRRELRMDQRTLAAAVGVSRQWIVQVERGKARAEAGLLLRALTALDLEIAIDPMAPDRGKPANALGSRADRPGRGKDILGAAPYDVDIDAVIEKARGKKQ